MRSRTVFGLLMAWLALAGPAVAEVRSEAPDRLDRFRRLAASRLGAVEVSGHSPSDEALGELYAILDDEIVESLAMGSFFASQGFLQERLDALAEVWGGAAFRILSLGGGAVGGFQLSPGGSGNSVRIYARVGGSAGLVRTIHREAVPALHEMPPTRAGAPQFLVAWVGPQSGRGSTTLRLELWRREGASAGLAWSTGTADADGLLVTHFTIREQEISFRYEVRYPGWKPGCEGQTEQEDVYRYVPARETFVMIRRQVVNGWHREVQGALAALLRALNARDARVLGQLVPDRSLRARLPDRLEADFACDEADGPLPTEVSIAAVSPAATAAGGVGGRPWTLVLRRTSAGWRLAAAVPVGDAPGPATEMLK